MTPIAVANWSDLADREPAYALVENVDLVVVRYGGEVSVLFGRCLHRGALLSDGFVDGDNIICGLHGWDYRIDTGISAYNNEEVLQKFESWIDDGKVWVDGDQVAAWEEANPQPYDREAYLGTYQDIHGTDDEPHVALIQEFARDGLSKVGHHGKTVAMGVPRNQLPAWDDIQFVTAQLARRPLLDDAKVGTELIVGPLADRPL